MVLRDTMTSYNSDEGETEGGIQGDPAATLAHELVGPAIDFESTLLSATRMVEYSYDDGTKVYRQNGKHRCGVQSL